MMNDDTIRLDAAGDNTRRFDGPTHKEMPPRKEARHGRPVVRIEGTPQTRTNKGAHAHLPHRPVTTPLRPDGPRHSSEDTADHFFTARSSQEPFSVPDRKPVKASAPHIKKSRHQEAASIEKPYFPDEQPTPPPQLTKSSQRSVQTAHQEKKRTKRRRGCGCLFYLLLPILVVLVAIAAFWAISYFMKPTPLSELPPAQVESEALTRAEHNVHLLLVGDDERNPNEHARSDTIIYTILRPVDKKIAMVSIPRDTLANIPNYGEDKINASLAVGGIDLLKKTVSQLTDAPVDHYIQVNFESFKKLVDAVGGITIDVPTKMYKPEENIDLQAGKQHLNGTQALAFVRWRDDGLGDLGRIERQKAFIKAFAKKCTHLMPWQAARLMKVLGHDVKSDMNTGQLMSLVVRMAGSGPDMLSYEKFELNPQYINGVSYVLLNRDNVHRVVNRMRYGIDLDNPQP